MSWIAQRRQRSRFETVALPHLDAAYSLARWLTRNDADAADVVQEAYLRAFRYFDSYREGDAKSWLLKIVRRTSYSWLERNRPAELVALETAADLDEAAPAAPGAAGDTEALLAEPVGSAPPRPAAGAAAGAAARGDRAARIARARLSRDRRGDRGADRHGDVPAAPRPLGVAPGLGWKAGPGKG